MKKNTDKEPGKILEEDLYKPVHDFLEKQGYTVRAEVNYCDVSAVKGDELIIVELKRNLSVALLSQAVKRQKVSDLVYVAVPKPQRFRADSKWKDICHLLRRLELGLMLVSLSGNKSFVEIAVEPKAFDRTKSKSANIRKRNSIIKETKGRYKDLNTGGSRGKKLMTSYREQSLFIACCLHKLGPMSPKKLREIGTDEKKTLSILSKNFYGWFDKVSRGVYGVNEEGIKNIEIYKELADYYYEKVDNINKLNEGGKINDSGFNNF